MIMQIKLFILFSCVNINIEKNFKFICMNNCYLHIIQYIRIIILNIKKIIIIEEKSKFYK